jgi:hypothetical protein
MMDILEKLGRHTKVKLRRNWNYKEACRQWNLLKTLYMRTRKCNSKQRRKLLHDHGISEKDMRIYFSRYTLAVIKAADVAVKMSGTIKTTTLADECAKQGKDWEEDMRRRMKQLEKKRKNAVKPMR